ncbi:hypothetical protein F5B19DRAFT_473691 [Rostrohypoxylon terebratum]|nr:hypothetical protein F5B19DRAFT_473691 [Rostrohypoxylon terebratum]
MSRRNSCVSDDNRKSRSRPASQHSRRSPHSQPRSPHPSPYTPYNKSSDKLAASQAHRPSPLKMVTTTTTATHTSAGDTLQYYLPDTNAQEIEFQKQGWLEPIVIDDDDLMFGGKSLSAWYEEGRQSVSFPAAEEEQRGRQRVSYFMNQSHT